MDIVIDTSALLAVIVGEPERERVVAATRGHTLVGPGAIPWEVGNAFSAMLKQQRITLDEARRGVDIFESVPLRFLKVNLENAVKIAHETHLYAYDAYFLDCAIRQSAPLLTLDKGLQHAAGKLGVSLIEV